MYLIAHLYGNREKQKKWHRGLRGPILSLLENGIIERFVLTYHYKGKDTDNLYLCIDVHDLSEFTMQALKEFQPLQPIVEYLKEEISLKEIKLGNYEDGLSQEVIDTASRGSASALKILGENPEEISNWKLLVKKVIDYCGPLDENWNDAAHFCFNSLGFNRREESIARTFYSLHHELDEMIERLFSRESWKFTDTD